MTPVVLFFLSASVLGGVVTKLIHRHVLLGVDAYPYALFQNAVAALLFLPFVFNSPLLETVSVAGWVVFACAGILWAALSISSLTSYKSTDLGLREIVGQSRVFWALLFGVILLAEPLTLSRTGGTLLVFLGMVLAIWHPEKRWGNFTDRGVLWTLFSALLSAAAAVFDKYALVFFPVALYGFAMYLIPTVIYLLFLKGMTSGVKHALLLKWKGMLAGTLVSALTYYFILKLFTLADVTLVYPFLQLSTLLTVLGAIIFLKERQHTLQRLVAAGVVFVGLIILK